MSLSFLHQRLVRGVKGATGTLSEPSGTPDPFYTLASTVNWMHSLAILVKETKIERESMRDFYGQVKRWNPRDDVVNTVFEQLLMGLHYLSALRAMAGVNGNHDLSRVAIIAWYYGVYCSASAMIAANNGSQQEAHAGTASQWDSEIAARSLIPKPFSYRLSSMVLEVADSEIRSIRSSSGELKRQPESADDAVGECASYLKGTREFEEKKIKEQLLSKEFKKAGLSNFRSTKAREIRDARLQGRGVGFLHQASRYRGKANYRDALFLTYQVGSMIDGFIENAADVLTAFLVAAGAFCARRVSEDDWGTFLDDLNQNLKLVVSPSKLWL